VREEFPAARGFRAGADRATCCPSPLPPGRPWSFWRCGRPMSVPSACTRRLGFSGRWASGRGLLPDTGRPRGCPGPCGARWARSERQRCPAGQGRCPPSTRRILRRRTFAIISHPDAGKTTLTEKKLLLFGGAIQMAGTRQGGARPTRHANLRLDAPLSSSAGISITSSGDAVSLRGVHRQSAGHSGARGFLRGTLTALLTAVGLGADGDRPAPRVSSSATVRPDGGLPACATRRS